mmetsp:Transcript_31576/g.28742  ORF Transcript_31576/g.28742 Transcript_31576/m.28742 type:complete len:80 (-) Transcript_31576:53-292(-)
MIKELTYSLNYQLDGNCIETEETTCQNNCILYSDKKNPTDLLNFNYLKMFLMHPPAKLRDCGFWVSVGSKEVKNTSIDL